MNKTILQILKQHWGFDSFRPLQEDIIMSVLQGRDTLALLPTGGGKSICFQVPALATGGLCLVVSPLIALMKDQVENLRRKGITAFAIHSGLSRKDVVNTFKVAMESNCKFLYVSPERLETNLFKEYLHGLDVKLIAIDEAHCISQWGYDFRPSYLRIAELRKEIPTVPLLALTASATLEVQKDICIQLQFKNEQIFRQSFDRPNLSYSVFNVDVKIRKVREILENVKGSSIVYCRSRKQTREVSDILNMHGVEAGHYHAGLKQDDRNAKQDSWVKDHLRVIVATNAFGMGIDKPAVRTVIHVDSPDSLEYYYQEAGRAGRDGLKSYGVLLYSKQDLIALESLPDLHFPSLQQIRIVYQALMNYLQVPSGHGKGNHYEFDLVGFTKQFQLDTVLVTWALKALEQEEFLSFNEQVFLPSRIAFSCDKDQVYQFEHDNPDLEPLLKTLLRTYPGIFDQPVAVHEKSIAYLLRVTPDEVIKMCHRLQQFGIIHYNPQTDAPKLYFIHDHIPSRNLQINQANYARRKEQYTRRVAAMAGYITTSTRCRGQFIANYFGDKVSKPCGVCDNCLRQKNQILSVDEFESIRKKIFDAVDSGNVNAGNILDFLAGLNIEKAWKVINHLQSEDMLVVDETGTIQMK